jgi:hypothetical protein
MTPACPPPYPEQQASPSNNIDLSINAEINSQREDNKSFNILDIQAPLHR